MLRMTRLSRVLLLSSCVYIFAGCGNSGDRPPLGTVTGTVTLDGKPLPFAVVKFDSQAKEGGRMSNGVADENGYYEMVYREYPSQIMGVKAGPCKVYIQTALGGDHPAGPRDETLPASYSGKDSIIIRNVEAASNVINFALKSDGSAPPE